MTDVCKCGHPRAVKHFRRVVWTNDVDVVTFPCQQIVEPGKFCPCENYEPLTAPDSAKEGDAKCAELNERNMRSASSNAAPAPEASVTGATELPQEIREAIGVLAYVGCTCTLRDKTQHWAATCHVVSPAMDKARAHLEAVILKHINQQHRE
jgi:hypothetical protein